MPLIDKPLPELKNYLGRNPKPEDFDRYWEHALAELDEWTIQFFGTARLVFRKQKEQLEKMGL